MKALAHILFPQEKTSKPVAHGPRVSFERHAGPTFDCALSVWTEPDNWVRVQWKAGLDSTVSTTPDVFTGSHQLSKIDTMAMTFAVYHRWLNKPCSWISKILDSHIFLASIVFKIQCHSFPNDDSFSTFIPRLPLFWLDLIFCHSAQSPNLDNKFLLLFQCIYIFVDFTS